jgi:hypothetical protein
MQTRLTQRLDSELIERAKDLASERHTSVSQLVAQYFGSLTSKDTPASKDPPLPPVTRSLVGVLKPGLDEQDYRDHLAQKHR